MKNGVLKISPIKICCDLDDVVFDFLGSFIPFIQKHAPAEFSIAPESLEGSAVDWDSWNGYENFGLNREQFLVLLKDFSERGGLRSMPMHGKYTYHYLSPYVSLTG